MNITTHTKETLNWRSECLDADDVYPIAHLEHEIREGTSKKLAKAAFHDPVNLTSLVLSAQAVRENFEFYAENWLTDQAYLRDMEAPEKKHGLIAGYNRIRVSVRASEHFRNWLDLHLSTWQQPLTSLGIAKRLGVTPSMLTNIRVDTRRVSSVDTIKKVVNAIAEEQGMEGEEKLRFVNHALEYILDENS